jgi:hypothetical protein
MGWKDWASGLLASRVAKEPPAGRYGRWDKASRIAAAELVVINKPGYNLGLLIGAIQAKKLGLPRIRALEFGVASGNGLRCLSRAAGIISRRLELEIEVVGFDSGSGLFAPKDFRDHPEIWSAGQYDMGDPEPLKRDIAPNGRLVLGDIAQTVHTLDDDATPIGFVSVDVDYYSSTVPILAYFETVEATRILPATPFFFDDVIVNWSYSDLAGEQLAIAEFNARSALRKIEPKLPAMKLFALQAVDHPVRQGSAAPVEPFEIDLRRLVPRGLLRPMN